MRIYIYIYCACVWNGVFHQFMTMLVGNWVLIHCSLNFMTHPHHSIPLHYIPNRQPLFWIQDIATRTSMMTGSQTLAFAIFHVKVLATLRPVRSCDAPATSNILFILWKLYMNATSSRFIEPNAMVSTYDPSKNQLQALDPTAVEDWWWAELIYGIWATYSQVQAQNDEVCLQREGTPAFYLLCFSSERQENQLNRRVTYDMRSVLILLALCIRMREPPKYPKFQTKTERSHSKCSEWTNTQYISILCCFFMLILCIRLTWSTRELGPCFFLQSQEVPSSRQDTTQGFLFDPRTLEPNINGPAFAEAIKHMRTMWQAGKARAGGNLQKEGCCVRENGAYRQQALYHQLVANPIIIWEMDFNGF